MGTLPRAGEGWSEDLGLQHLPQALLSPGSSSNSPGLNAQGNAMPREMDRI